MRKPRTDSHWNNLNPDQRQTLDQWLFVDQVAYTEIVTRARTEFGLEASISSVSRYYQRRARERQLAELTNAQELSDAVCASEWDIDLMRSASVKLLAKTALNMVCRTPEKITELGSLLRLLLLSEANDLRRQRIELCRERYGEQSLAETSKELPNLAQLLVRIENDETLTDEMKAAKIKAMLYPVTGPKPADLKRS